jgi:hypothetical protein
VALIFRGKTECSLCGNVIMAGDEIVATSHLWRFSDSAMHRGCFLTWDQRAAFVAKYNRLVGGITFGNGTFHQLEPDGSIAVLKRSE